MIRRDSRLGALVRGVLPWLVAAVGLVSALVGVRGALARSQDFQWSGARMLLDRVDPWLDFLRGDPLHRILLLQIPNYLPLLYVLLVPFGLVPFAVAKTVWVVCNLGFAVASVVIAGRFYGLRGRWLLVALGLFLMATCVRNTLGNGQQGLLVLLLWCLALLSPALTGRRAAVAGISYFKFSFAPPLLMFLLIRGGVRAVLCSVLVPAAGTVLVWLWLTGGHDAGALLRIVVEPFQVSRTGFLLRGGDVNLMDVLDPVFHLARVSLPATDTWELVIATVLCALVFWLGIVRSPRSTIQYQVALFATTSFGLFRHHNYDQVVLLLPMCFALARWRIREAKVVLGVLACLFYFQRVVELTPFYSRWFYLPEFVLLVCAGAMLYRLRYSPEAAAL